MNGVIIIKRIKNLIIGAGISGLSYAVYCDGDYLIVEKEQEPGGLCRTIYKDGFIWDYAGHFFHFANEEIKKLFEAEIASDDIVKCIKTTNINYYGKVVDYPFQMNIHQLPQQEFIDCLYDLFNKIEKDNYASFEDMLYGKFGKSITEKFLKPYNEKLYACDLNELDRDAMGRFFPYAKPVEIINNMKNNTVKTYNSSFDYPKQGAKFFINILLKKIDRRKLMLGTSVDIINPDLKIVKIGDEWMAYENLINTVPLNQFVQLLPERYQPKNREILSANKVLVFNIGLDRQAIDTETHWTYFPSKDLNFYRVGYYSNILGADRLSLYVEIGYEENAKIDIEKQYHLTLKNLKKCGIITNHQVVANNTLVINPGYVHITEKSNQYVSELKKKLAEKHVYTIGRYGSWTYCSIEDCLITAMNLAKIQNE